MSIRSARATPFTSMTREIAERSQDSVQSVIIMADIQPLSSRGQTNVKAVMPHIPHATREGIEDANVINLATAENWVLRGLMTDICRDAMTKTLDPKNLSWPSGFFGMPQLLHSAAKFLNARFRPHKPIQHDHLTIAPGASGCVMSLMWNLCEAGDAVLIPSPYWYSYDFFTLIRTSVSVIGAEVPSLEDAMGEQMLAALERAYSTSERPVRALMISNPHNPLGRCWTREMLEAMYRFCQVRNLHFISDEIFASVTFNAPDYVGAIPFTSVLQLDAAALGCDDWRAHTIWSPSKLFGISGLRLGLIVTRAGQKFRDGLALSAPQEVSMVSSVFLLHILQSEDPSQIIEQSSELLSKHYSVLTSALREVGIPYLPCNCTVSLMARIAPDATTWEQEEAVVKALGEAGVVVGSGKAYHVPAGNEGWARLTFAVPVEKLQDGIRRMQSILI